MVQGKVEISGVNTAKLPRLKEEEMDEWFRRFKEGDMEAREKIISGNLRLVLSVIKRFASSNENVDDLFQIGCVGLIKAIDNFDITLGLKLSTYGIPMIIVWGENCRNMSKCFWNQGFCKSWLRNIRYRINKFNTFTY